jgi:hypothetical protein
MTSAGSDKALDETVEFGRRGNVQAMVGWLGG